MKEQTALQPTGPGWKSIDGKQGWSVHTRTESTKSMSPRVTTASHTGFLVTHDTSLVSQEFENDFLFRTTCGIYDFLQLGKSDEFSPNSTVPVSPEYQEDMRRFVSMLQSEQFGGITINPGPLSQDGDVRFYILRGQALEGSHHSKNRPAILALLDRPEDPRDSTQHGVTALRFYYEGE